MSGINSGQSLGALGVKVEVLGVNKVTTDLDKVERSFKKTTDTVKKTTKETKLHGAAQRKLSFVMLEASRGAEDFAVGFGVNGMQGAIRGATNNISQLFSIISPLAGTIAGFAGAGVAAIAVFVGMAKRAKEAADGIEELNEALKEQNKLRLQALRFDFKRRDIAEAGSAKGASAAERRAQRNVETEEIIKDNAERTRDEKIQEFGKRVFDFRFKDLIDFNEGGDTQRKRERAFLDSILNQQGIETDPNKRDFSFQELESKRRTVREDLSIGNVPSEFINNAVKAMAKLDDVVSDEFNEFIKKATAGVNIATRAVERLKKEARDLADDAKKLAADPKSKESVKKKEDAQKAADKAADKAATEEEARNNKAQKTIDKLNRLSAVGGLSPFKRDQFEIQERAFARQKAIRENFFEQGAPIEQVSRLEQQSAQIFNDEISRSRRKQQAKDDDLLEKEARIRKAELAGFGDFAKGFLPSDDRRKLRLEEEIGGIRSSQFLSRAQKRSTISGLRGLFDLDEQRRDIAGAPKPSASFAGVTEFAKQFQLQISKKSQELKQNLKLEGINEKILDVNKRQLTAIRDIPKGSTFK